MRSRRLIEYYNTTTSLAMLLAMMGTFTTTATIVAPTQAYAATSPAPADNSSFIPICWITGWAGYPQSGGYMLTTPSGAPPCYVTCNDGSTFTVGGPAPTGPNDAGSLSGCETSLNSWCTANNPPDCMTGM